MKFALFANETKFAVGFQELLYRAHLILPLSLDTPPRPRRIAQLSSRSCAARLAAVQASFMASLMHREKPSPSEQGAVIW